jgi:RNA polymerase-binding transcription factor DksA
MLSKQKIKEYKERLEKEKRRLVKELKEAETPESFGRDVDSFDEEADEAEEFTTHLATGQLIRDRINEIDSALNDLRLGKYGICKKCGVEISEKVLDVSPESRFCRNCKKKTK